MIAASISMRSATGICFGSATWIGLTELEVECPEGFVPGQEIEFQLELPGLRETVYGRAVVRAFEPVVDAPNRCRLRIARLRAGDEVLLREWVDDMQQGGSSAHPHLHVPSTQLSSVNSSPPTVDFDAIPRGAISTWDAHRAASAGPGGRGRSSVRRRLREHFERSAEPADAPEITDTAIDPAVIDIEITEP